MYQATPLTGSGREGHMTNTFSDEDICGHGRIGEICRQCAQESAERKARQEAEREAFRAKHERRTIRRKR